MEIARIEVDARRIADLGAAFKRAGAQAPAAIARALNHTGDKALTQVKRALVAQTGAKYGAISKALMRRGASAGNPVYRIVARAAAMSLKEFGPVRTASGVSAAPWNKRRVFPSSFIVAKLGGHVFVRTSRRRFPIKKLWGPVIPNEMLRDMSRQAFEATVEQELPARLQHEIGAILSGVAPRGR